MRAMLVLLFVFAVVGCPAVAPLGAPCDPDPARVAAAITVAAGTNSIVDDGSLSTCPSLCTSTGAPGLDASRPYCTEPCTSDGDCGIAGFTCGVIVQFGPQACDDFEDPAGEQPAHAGESSGTACTGDAQCTVAGETCFVAGARAGSCGFVGRDCLTGPGGGLSAQTRRYCVAAAGALR